MNAKTARTNSILTSVMLFLYAGCIVLNILLALLTRNTLFTLPAGILLCLSVLIPAILLCRQAKQGKDRTAKILSVLSLIVSIVWTLVSGLYWMLTIARSLIVEIYLRMSMPMMSMEQLFRLLNFLGIAYTVFTTLVALGLIALFVLSVIRPKQKWLQIKAELHKPAAAVLILVPNLFTLAGGLINKMILRDVDLGKLTLDAYTKFTLFFSYGEIAAELLIVLALAVFVLVFGLMIKKQTDTAQEAQPTREDQAQQPSDIPFHLPAGVNADDI